MADLANIVHDYLAQRHFDLMDADRKDRFDTLKKQGLFTGHMKKWDELYEGKTLRMLNTTITDKADWERLYDSCQQAFQGMDSAKTDEVGYGGPYNGPTKAFIAKWFGDSTKVFTNSTATDHAENLFKELGNFLETHKSDLKPRFIQNLSYVFNDKLSYEDFYKQLKEGKFNTDQDFRSKLESVVQYITTYGPIPGNPPPENENWPLNLGYVVVGGAVDLNDDVLKGVHNAGPWPIKKDEPEKWYQIPYKPYHIKRFKDQYSAIFDVLLTNSTIRSKFLEKAGSPIREALEQAIKNTDYENQESDDYVHPDPVDEKNLTQKIKKWGNDTYENHFRRFFNHNRGTRKFFSPFSQNIMKALDKAGVKPTDGIDGILAKKDDAKLKNVIKADKLTEKHFNWFTKTMATIKEQIPDAYEGALKNGHQLRQVAMYVITMAARDGEVEKAKTALEILSVAKYGLTCSNRLDKLKAATKDMSVFGDEKLSWNKNDGLKVVTKALDKTAGFAIRGVGTVATGVYNFIQHRRTKISKDILAGKDKDHPYHHLYNEYTEWQGKDKFKRDALHDENVTYGVAKKLAKLANPARAIGGYYKTNVKIDDTTMGTKETPGPLRVNLEAAITAGSATVFDPTSGLDIPIAELQNDVAIYEDVHERDLLDKDDTKWREKNPDSISDLVAYWNMLETYGKSHSFMLGSMKTKRKNFLENWKDGNSQAQETAKLEMQQFGQLRAA